MMKKIKAEYSIFIRVIIVILAIIGCITTIDNSRLNNVSSSYQMNGEWINVHDMVSLPMTGKGIVEIENTFPRLYDDDYMYIALKNANVEVFVNDKKIFSPQPMLFWGNKLEVDETIALVPLKEEYSWKKVKLRIHYRESIYNSFVSSVKIDNIPNFIYTVIHENFLLLLFIFCFMSFGIIETIIACIIFYRRIRFKDSNFMEYLCVYGLFSVVASMWLLCNTDLLSIITGAIATFQLINYVMLMLMIPLFTSLIYLMQTKKNKLLWLTKNVLWLVCIVDFALVCLGIDNWEHVLYLAHGYSLVGIFVILVAAVREIYTTEQIRLKRTLIGTLAMSLGLSVAAISAYLVSIDSLLYLDLFSLALVFFGAIHIGLVVKKIKQTSEEEKLLVDVTKAANTDELTEIGNRHYYESIAREYEVKPVYDEISFIYMDVNMLKHYNDTLGHDAGDELLIGAANCIKNAIGNQLVFRMGGDEFAAIIKGGADETAKIVEKLKQEIVNYKFEHYPEMKLSVSIGVASSDAEKRCDISELAAIADRKMYDEKKSFYENRENLRRTI